MLDGALNKESELHTKLWKIYTTYGWGFLLVIRSNTHLHIASIKLLLNDLASCFNPFFLTSSRLEVIEFTLGVKDSEKS